ncbi:FHA domain-containing protein [Arenicella xantha]|uniref:FHA domain protein n=1 Tax=Arenicella xantha TaxID=644221 RepID=A0A395JNA0_9GAMM|nr:FHA domain-containing protein [Arenicella xantha]RBP51277.1 FHA domain protein [Arenicella xantha]
MAYLRMHATDNIDYLREYHTIGRRNQEIDTYLDFPEVSKLHAVIEWKQPNWVIRDMSSNGTWINNDRLPPYTTHLLKQHDQVKIADNPQLTFEIADITPPVDMIFASDDKLHCQTLAENRLLPDHDSPSVEIYKCPERHQWFAQHIQGARDQAVELGPFEHDSQLRVDDTDWTFFIVNDSDETKLLDTNQNRFDDVEFRFDLSQDEENATLKLIHGAQQVDLQERSHHYLLVHLLRQKQAASGDHNSAPKLGWIDCELLMRDLGIDHTHMNILVYRARQQITAALVGFAGASRLFERRRGAIRTGIERFSIYKEGQREV